MATKDGLPSADFCPQMNTNEHRFLPAGKFGLPRMARMKLIEYELAAFGRLFGHR